MPREVHRIDIVAQATFFLIHANVPAHMVPVGAEVLAIVDGHERFYLLMLVLSVTSRPADYLLYSKVCKLKMLKIE